MVTVSVEAPSNNSISGEPELLELQWVKLDVGHEGMVVCSDSARVSPPFMMFFLPSETHRPFVFGVFIQFSQSFT